MHAEIDYFNHFLSALCHPALLLTPQGEILSCNTLMLDLYELSRYEFLHRNIFSVSQEHGIPPPFATIEGIQKNHQTNTTVTKKGLHDNHIKTIQWSASHLKIDNQNEVILIIGFDISAFISESKQEKNIKNSIIDHIPNHYIFWKDKNSVYLGCNAELASAVGLTSSADIIGKTDYDLPTTKEQSDAYRADDQLVMETRKPKLNIEEQQTLLNGEVRVLSTSKTPLLDDQGHVYGVLAIYSDITERKNIELSLEKAKNQAEAANLAKTEFIVNMSHDIRTPLSGIVGISRLLEASAQHPNDKQYARWINQSGEQLLDLLNGVLDVVSAEQIKDSDVSYEHFDLRQCIHEICQLELPTIKMKGLELQIDVQETLPLYIVSDYTKLHRILLNLLGNAIKFTETGSIHITVEQLTEKNNNAQIKFSVIDTGIGIPLELQDKVFDRFYRASLSAKGVYQGHGIGLHIAQKYVTLLGGDIQLTSALGIGTTFSFTLPFKVGQDGHAMPGHERGKTSEIDIENPSTYPTTDNSTSEKKPIPIADALHVLLVEDNVVALHLIETIVSQAGLKFTSTINGEQALTLAKSRPFDLIITDIGLPGISGYELTYAIRQWERDRNKKPIPIIGLTAHALCETQKEYMQSGFNTMLSKPINLNTIQGLIKQYIAPTDDTDFTTHRENKGKIGRGHHDAENTS